MIRRPPRSTPLYSSAASDVYKRQGLKSGWSRSIIFSEDDKPFLSRWLADARDEMMRALSAYLSDESVSTETALVFAVLLSRQRPLALDESICHQLERAIVCLLYTSDAADE